MLIYCIEDINDLKYVGSTKDTLSTRLSKHRTDKRLGRNTSSKLLNLDYCIIYELEKITNENKYEREVYWMNKLESVNNRRGQSKMDRTDYRKEYYDKNKDEISKYMKEYYKQHKEERKAYNTKYYYDKKIKI